MANTVTPRSSKEATLVARESANYSAGKLLAGISSQISEMDLSTKFTLAIKVGLTYDLNFLSQNPANNQYLYQTIRKEFLRFGDSPNMYNYKRLYWPFTFCTNCAKLARFSSEFSTANPLTPSCSSCCAKSEMARGWKCVEPMDKNTGSHICDPSFCANYNFWHQLFARLTQKDQPKFVEIFLNILDKWERR